MVVGGGRVKLNKIQSGNDAKVYIFTSMIVMFVPLVKKH